MPRTAITYDDVALACERILHRGDRPSHRNVRTEVGRGSLSTIGEHLRTWHSRLPATPMTPMAAPIQALETLSPQVAAAVHQAYRAAVAQELERAQARALEAEQRLDSVADALTTSEREREALEDRVEQLDLQLERLQGTVRELYGAISDRIAQLSDALSLRIDQGFRQMQAPLHELRQSLEDRLESSGVQQQTLQHTLEQVLQDAARTARYGKRRSISWSERCASSQLPQRSAISGAAGSWQRCARTWRMPRRTPSCCGAACTGLLPAASAASGSPSPYLPGEAGLRLICSENVGADQIASQGKAAWSQAMIPVPRIKGRSHLITLSIDDGFRSSCLQMAEVFQRHGIPGCFNVLARNDGSFGGAEDDVQIGVPQGDFALWRQLAAEGHEIQPHGWNHTNKASVPLARAQELIQRCLARFEQEMPGFARQASVFNFPYNSSTPELEAWLLGQVRGYRTSGTGLHPLPHAGLRRLTSCGFGPGDSGAHCEAMIAQLLRQEEGWLVYNLHGIAPEGWGPVTIAWLDGLLGRLARLPQVAVVPAAMALSLSKSI